jgi:anti-sigma B factor antagonist
VRITIMKIEETLHGPVAVLSLKGNMLTEPESVMLRKRIYELTERDIKRVVVDIGNVEYISSVGLGALIASMITLRNKGGDLHIARTTEKTGPIFMLTQTVKVLKIYENSERAISAFR